MSLVYSEEQRLLADTASEFLAARSPVSAQRRLRDEGSAEGFDPALWQEMVNLGWSAIPFPEALGGLDFGCKGLGAVFEQIGSKLGAAPLLSSIVLGGSVLELAGSAAQQSEWLPALIAGEKRIALALDEQPRHDPAGTALAARREGEGWVLTGDKVFVVDGLGADAFVVVVPEYNHGYPAALKYVIDSVQAHWQAKPVAFVAYGGHSGGVRAAEQLRQVFSGLHAVPVRDGVYFTQAWDRFDTGGRPRDGDAKPRRRQPAEPSPAARSWSVPEPAPKCGRCRNRPQRCQPEPR